MSVPDREFRVYSHFPLTKGMAYTRVHRRIRTSGAATILDLEDSAWDPLSGRRTDALKETARMQYLKLARGFLLIKARLMALSPRCVAMCTLNEAQGKVLLGERSGWSDEPCAELDERTGADDQAHRIVDTYHLFRRHRRRFAVDRESGRFIPPHEYLAALKHLKAAGGGPYKRRLNQTASGADERKFRRSKSPRSRLRKQAD